MTDEKSTLSQMPESISEANPQGSEDARKTQAASGTAENANVSSKDGCGKEDDSYRTYLLAEYQRFRMITLVFAIIGFTLILAGISLSVSGVLSTMLYNLIMSVANLFILLTAVVIFTRTRPFKRRLKEYEGQAGSDADADAAGAPAGAPTYASGTASAPTYASGTAGAPTYASGASSPATASAPKPAACAAPSSLSGSPDSTGAPEGMMERVTQQNNMDDVYKIFERKARTELIPESPEYHRLRRVWLCVYAAAAILAIASLSLFYLYPDLNVVATVMLLVAFILVIVAFYIDRTRMRPMRVAWARQFGMTEMQYRDNMR